MAEVRISAILIDKLKTCHHPRIIVGIADIAGISSVGCNNETSWLRSANLLHTLIPGGFNVTGIFVPNKYILNPKYRKKINSIQFNSTLHMLTFDKMGNIKSLRSNVILIRTNVNLDEMLDTEKLIRGNVFVDLKIPITQDDNFVNIMLKAISRQLKSAAVVVKLNESTKSKEFRIMTNTNSGDMSDDGKHWLSIKGWFYTCAHTTNDIIEDIERTIYARLPSELTISCSYVSLPRRCCIDFKTLEISDYQHIDDTDATTVERLKNNFRIASISTADVRHTSEPCCRKGSTCISVSKTRTILNSDDYYNIFYIAIVAILVMFFAYLMQRQVYNR
ncbi:hypothetical protein GJ496_011604 [Pomphorhynchus laevis]|nr:hypothetical protein GJ496_011604 [Pomphorhynchus laevis]